jgi:hypothetical protein
MRISKEKDVVEDAAMESNGRDGREYVPLTQARRAPSLDLIHCRSKPKEASSACGCFHLHLEPPTSIALVV